MKGPFMNEPEWLAFWLADSETGTGATAQLSRFGQQKGPVTRAFVLCARGDLNPHVR
jgi:hypothetical protein